MFSPGVRAYPWYLLFQFYQLFSARGDWHYFRCGHSDLTRPLNHSPPRQNHTRLEGPSIWLINFLYPAAVGLGSLFGIDKDRVRGSFIAIRNRLTSLRTVKARPEQVLILLPHCLQLADCQYKVTTDADNCRRCGRCVIADILKLKDRYGVNVAVATGGTLARRQVKELRPKVVLAVACERDLASGIADIERVQVYGITNERPHGPCFNTTVDYREIEKAVQAVLE